MAYAWLAVYTNAYQDSDGEFFTTPAIQADVERIVATGLYPQLWVDHNPRLHIGEATYVATAGRFAFALGTMDEAWGKLLAGRTYGCSHGFHYVDSDQDTYYTYHSYEISLLLSKTPANQLAFILVWEV
jgi:hypothetical protein